MANMQNSSISKVTFTKAAANKFKELQEKLKVTSTGIKFADKKGFCGEGYDYVIDFAFTPDENDEIFYSQEIPIFVPKSSLLRLQGSVVDCSFKTEENSSDLENLIIREYFDIYNPNIKGPCPCACGNGFSC